ncbi:MAG: hypothetical protein RIS76_3702, partial [Verrucomicrobiota bacterium]
EAIKSKNIDSPEATPGLQGLKRGWRHVPVTFLIRGISPSRGGFGGAHVPNAGILGKISVRQKPETREDVGRMIFPETFSQHWGSMQRTPRSRTALAAHQVSRLGFWNRRDTYSLPLMPIPVRS